MLSEEFLDKLATTYIWYCSFVLISSSLSTIKISFEEARRGRRGFFRTKALSKFLCCVGHRFLGALLLEWGPRSKAILQTLLVDYLRVF